MCGESATTFHTPAMLMCATLLLLLPCSARAFTIVLDLNTYNASELAYATTWSSSSWPGRPDGSWTIEENSHGVQGAQWSAAIGGLGPSVFSEDNPGSNTDCRLVRAAANCSLTASFQYHETGGMPATMLNASEISSASAACDGAPIIILTRAYWPGSQWRTRVESVLHHEKLFGVAT